jgi:hypothetical protein
MGKSIGKILGLAAAVTLSVYAIVWRAPLPEDAYLQAAVLKHQLLEKTPSPRFIFIGGSNLVFGLDSRTIHKHFGIPVVNMGLNNGLGLRFMMREVLDEIRAGDMVVAVPEYNFTLEPTNTLLEYLLFYPRGVRYVDVAGFLTLLREFPLTTQRRFEGHLRNRLLSQEAQNLSLDYNAAAFNEYGDNTGHLSQPDKKIPLQPLGIPAAIPEAVAALNRFKRKLDKKGAFLFLSFSPIPESNFSPTTKKKGLKLRRWLNDKADFVILGGPADFVFPDNMFYDTIFHLNKEGRAARSYRLVNKLDRALKEMRAPLKSRRGRRSKSGP